MPSTRRGARTFVAAFILLLVAAHPCAARQPTFTPYRAGGIYAPGEKVGWTAELPPGASRSAVYTYTVRKNNQGLIKTGTLDFTSGRGGTVKPNQVFKRPAPAVQSTPNRTPAADQPSPRADRNSMLAHAELLEKRTKGRIDVYFLGDSITRRWGTSDEQYRAFYANWRQNFHGWNAANFGWGGDTTQNILWRLHDGELDNVNPKVIVLMAGTNNVGDKSPQGPDDPRAADVTRGIKAIIDLCRRKAPGATIVLMGLTPRNDNMDVMPVVNRINANISKLADGKRVRFLNTNDRLADAEGRLLEGMASRDGLHLDVKGYQVWADALKPILTKLLGPPAKEDHAPPPTGDPSARK